ncbi:hypothetical protein N9V84_06520 [Verrucomicrobiales bacterium]|nr:hypothetical protein [Verrucomicrobiales bacterium]
MLIIRLCDGEINQGGGDDGEEQNDEETHSSPLDTLQYVTLNVRSLVRTIQALEEATRPADSTQN